MLQTVGNDYECIHYFIHADSCLPGDGVRNYLSNWSGFALTAFHCLLELFQ